MKKLFLTTAVLLVALMAQAQTKIAPKLENGFKAVYNETTTINMGNESLNITTDEEFVVSNVGANGATITNTLTKVECDGDDADVSTQMLLIPVNMLKGVALKLATDANGQVTKIQNYAQAKAIIEENLDKLVSQVLADNAELAQALTKEKLKEQFAKQIEEDAILSNIKDSGVMALNGKTITNGATETMEKDGLKMKTMYFVAGKSIIANATLDMTKDELKALIIKQVEKEAPEQVAMIKENIDMMIDQMKMEASQKTTYSMSENGWPKSIKEEFVQDMMGQKVTQTSVTTLK